VPSPAKVDPSLNSPKSPFGGWGVGVASSLARSPVLLVFEVFDSNDEVLNDVFPNEAGCAGVLAHDGREDPAVEPIVIVEPLGSVFRPGNADFCCGWPNDPKPDGALLVLPKLEKPELPFACPNLANPLVPLAAAEKGFA
jgi:hypothetical protein